MPVIRNEFISTEVVNFSCLTLFFSSLCNNSSITTTTTTNSNHNHNHNYTPINMSGNNEMTTTLATTLLLIAAFIHSTQSLTCDTSGHMPVTCNTEEFENVCVAVRINGTQTYGRGCLPKVGLFTATNKPDGQPENSIPEINQFCN